jgi:hypothetical protein
VRKVAFYNIFIEFWESTKLVRLIEMRLNETHDKVEYAIKKFQEDHMGLKSNGTHQL